MGLLQFLQDSALHTVEFVGLLLNSGLHTVEFVGLLSYLSMGKFLIVFSLYTAELLQFIASLIALMEILVGSIFKLKISSTN